VPNFFLSEKAGKTLKRTTLICTGTLRPILERNPDKSFPSCYLQSLLQLCIEIFISSITGNQPLTVSTVQLLYTVKEKGGQPDRKPYPLPSGLRNPYRKLKSENSQEFAGEI
jgi:hypothetical protein